MAKDEVRISSTTMEHCTFHESNSLVSFDEMFKARETVFGVLSFFSLSQPVPCIRQEQHAIIPIPSRHGIFALKHSGLTSNSRSRAWLKTPCHFGFEELNAVS